MFFNSIDTISCTCKPRIPEFLKLDYIVHTHTHTPPSPQIESQEYESNGHSNDDDDHDKCYDDGHCKIRESEIL